jgi:hypothetical protein
MRIKAQKHNSTLAIGGVSSSLDSFVAAESSVLRTNPDSYRDAEKPAHRQFANRQAVIKLKMTFDSFGYLSDKKSYGRFESSVD